MDLQKIITLELSSSNVRHLSGVWGVGLERLSGWYISSQSKTKGTCKE